jgi:type VI secretion system protein ImpK
MSDDDRTLLPDNDRTLLPGDERTLLMPAPGGQPTQATLLTPRTVPRPATDLHRWVAGVNPLLDAAATLLGLARRLRATAHHPDPAGLREQLLAQVAEFEARAAAAGVAKPRIGAARYLLCSFLDEVVAATPWGQGAWAQGNLLQAFHDERWGGRKTFELLERLGHDPAAHVDLLELFDVCILLGYEGQFQGRPGGREQLKEIAARLHQAVRAQRPPSAPSQVLSLNLQPAVVSPAAARLRALPAWVAVAFAALAVIAIVLVLNQRLETLAAPAFKQIHAIAAGLRVERAAAPAAAPRLAAALQGPLQRGELGLREEAQSSLLSVPADTLFQPGTARLKPEREPLLAAVAQALKPQRGDVAVIGHSDDAPPASLQFPRAWHLTRAQAQAVMEALQRHGLPAERLRAEGRADAEPVAPGHGSAERARNRRIEIELRLPRPEGAPR